MLQCKQCHRVPNVITEYIVSAKEYRCTPDEYVQREEGTYNRMTQKFYCTQCYINVGMPLGTA